MTAIRKLGMSGRAIHTIFHCVLWLSILLSFFSCQCDDKSVSNHYLTHVQISALVGIIVHSQLKYYVFELWFSVLLLFRCAIKQKTYFQDAVHLQQKFSAERYFKYSKLHRGNLAFGGRGPPYVVRGYRIFDSTLGYPGEGWGKLSFATWNTRSLTYERFQYCNSLKYDVLAMTELWRNQSKYQTRNKKFIVNKPKTIPKGPDKGKIRYPEDKAAGVGLLLSDRLEKKVTSFGSAGERICWARIRGPVCHLFDSHISTA